MKEQNNMDSTEITRNNRDDADISSEERVLRHLLPTINYLEK